MPIGLPGIGVLYGSMRIASFLTIATWRSGACTNSSWGYVNPKRLSSAGSRPSGKTGTRTLRQLIKTEAAADIMNRVADLGYRESCAPDNANYPKWTSWDVVKIAKQEKIPPALLASVAWAEVGASRTAPRSQYSLSAPCRAAERMGRNARHL